MCSAVWSHHTKNNWKQCQQRIPDALKIRTYFFMGVGAFLILLVFIWFVFSRGTLNEILECFEYIVMDTERQKSFWEKLAKYFIRIHRYYTGLVYLTAILSVLYLIARKAGKQVSGELYMIA